MAPTVFLEENDDTKLKALIYELYNSTNNTQDKIKYKILLDALLKSDNSLSDKTARRQIDALLKEGITEAISIRNLKVWIERKDQSNKRSQKFICFEIVDNAC